MSTTLASSELAASVTPIPGDGARSTRWHPATLFAFRVACIYFALEWVPMILSSTTSSLTAGALEGPRWYRPLNLGLGQWVITNVLGLPEHSPPRRTSNDLPFFLGIVSAVVLSLAGAIAWSLIDRRRKSHPQLFTWLHTFMRFMAAAMLLPFAWQKVLPPGIQFPFTFDYFTLELGQYDPRDLLWAFMGASRGYQVFSGTIELAGAILLLFRRTAMLGALIAVAAMTHVFTIDVAYSVPAKITAGQILSMTLFLVAPFVPRLANVVVLNRATAPDPDRLLFRTIKVDRAARVLGVCFALWVIFAYFDRSKAFSEASRRPPQSPLYGIWNVEETTINGETVPPLITDKRLWRRLVVYGESSAIVIPTSTSWQTTPTSGRYSYKLDTGRKAVQFTPFPFSDTTTPMSFVYERRDNDHLILQGKNDDGAVVSIRLVRVDPQSYKLLEWRTRDAVWTW